MNMAPSNTLKSMEIIQSIETTLKTQFSDVKCHLIGSHVYGVAMGGLATYDFYLDLCKCGLFVEYQPFFVHWKLDQYRWSRFIHSTR